MSSNAKQRNLRCVENVGSSFCFVVHGGGAVWSCFICPLPQATCVQLQLKLYFFCRLRTSFHYIIRKESFVSFGKVDCATFSQRRRKEKLNRFLQHTSILIKYVS